MSLAVVSGGTRGIGKAVAAELIKRGHHVVIVGKDPERARTSAEEIGAEYEVADFQDITQTRDVANRILKTYGDPEIVVLSHGVMSDRTAKTLRTTDDEWHRVVTINLDAVFTLVNAFGAKMVENRKGRIVVLSACLGRMSGPGTSGGLAPYRISKAGVNALVKNLGYETGHGSRGFLIDAVCPNHTRTDMGGPDAPRSIEEGAETAIWLATRDFSPGDITGVLWEDREVIPW